MTRLPHLTAQDLVRFLKAQGFIEDRQSGSPLTLRHSNRNISVTIPVHTGCDACGFILLQVGSVNWEQR